MGAGPSSFFVVWQSRRDPTYREIRGRRFSASGAPLGSEVRVNVGSCGSASYGEAMVRAFQSSAVHQEVFEHLRAEQ